MRPNTATVFPASNPLPRCALPTPYSLTVGTPSRRGDGFADLTYLYGAAREIAADMRASPSPPFSEGKSALDAKLPNLPGVLHDLRRTARSLMSRAGVRPDIAERALGHAIPGVEGV